MAHEDVLGYVNYYGIDTHLVRSDHGLCLRAIFKSQYNDAINSLNFINRDDYVLKSLVQASIIDIDGIKSLKTIFGEAFSVFDFEPNKGFGYLCTYKGFHVYGRLDLDICDDIVYSATKFENEMVVNRIECDHILYPHINKIFHEIDWRVKRDEFRNK